MKSYNVTLNFGGFYESEHSDDIDNYIEDEELQLKDNDYQELLIDYCKEYINAMNNEINTNIEYISLNSPKHYNYSTDTITIKVTNNDIFLLKKYLLEYYEKEELHQLIKEIIKECTTRRDGYIPFYSYSDFFKKENRALLFECYFDALLTIEDFKEKILYDIDIYY